MLKKPILVIMAAGMGSRYGGLKQIDQLGPNGEIILDYSVNYAIEAGFEEVVFIIKKEIEIDFKKIIEPKFNNKIHIKYAYQELNNLPIGYSVPENREKPWGTGHAIICAKNEIGNNNFIINNADDYYGPNAYKTIYNYLTSSDYDNNFSMVAYYLKNVLSENGGVTRGICSSDNNKFLSKIVETDDLKRNEKNIITDENNNEYHEDTLISMNFWSLNKKFIDFAEEKFINFLNIEGKEMKSEFLLPTIINDMLNLVRVKVLSSPDKWLGITYKNDKPTIQKALKDLK